MARERGAGGLAGRWPDNPGEHFHKRAFPGSVGADDGGHARRRKISAHALQRKMLTIPHGEIADLDSAVAAVTCFVDGVGMVAAVETADEGGLRMIAQRREQSSQVTTERGDSGAPHADHIGKSPTPARAIRRIGHYKSR